MVNFLPEGFPLAEMIFILFASVFAGGCGLYGASFLDWLEVRRRKASPWEQLTKEQQREFMSQVFLGHSDYDPKGGKTLAEFKKELEL